MSYECMRYECLAIADNITGSKKRVSKVLRTLDDPKHGIMARFKAMDLVKNLVVGEAASQKVCLTKEEVENIVHAVFRDIRKNAGRA